MGGAASCCGGRSVSVMATNTDTQPWTRDQGVGSSAADLLARAPQTQDEDGTSSRTSSCVSVGSIHVDSVCGYDDTTTVGDNGASSADACGGGGLDKDRTFVLGDQGSSQMGQGVANVPSEIKPCSKKTGSSSRQHSDRNKETRPRSRNISKSKRTTSQRPPQSIVATEVKKTSSATTGQCASNDNKVLPFVNHQRQVHKYNKETKSSEVNAAPARHATNRTFHSGATPSVPPPEPWDPHCGDFTSSGVKGQAAHILARDGSVVSAGTRGNDLHANTENELAEGTAKPERVPYEGFFVPIGSPSAQTPTKKPRKKNQNGTAFVITFNDSGIDSESLGGQDDDTIDEHKHRSIIPSKPTTSNGHSSLAPNRTTGRQSISGHPFALRNNQLRSSPITETLKHYDAYKQARRSVEKPNFRTLSPNPVNIVAPDQLDNNRIHHNIGSKSPLTPASRKPYNIRNNMSINHRYSTKDGILTKHRSDKQKSKDELMTEIEALNQHIRDLRQLLRLQIRHRANDAQRGKATQTAFGQKPPTSGSPACTLGENLVQNMQTEIVRLENELIAKQTTVESRETECDEARRNESEESADDKDGMTSSSSETGSNGLHPAYKQALSNLDHDFATQLASAEGNISDDELRALLNAYISQRQQLKDEMIQTDINDDDDDGGDTNGELAVNRSATYVANGTERDSGPDVTSSGETSSGIGEVQSSGYSQTTASNSDAYTQHGVNCQTIGTTMEEDEENIKSAVNSFTEMAISRDEVFTQTVWSRRQDMSPDELQRLIAEHFDDVSNIRKMRQREGDRLSDKLKTKLAGKVASTSTDGSSTEDSDTQEPAITAEENDASDEDDHSSTYLPARVPVSREDMEKMLKEHRERERETMERKLAKNRQHRDSIALRFKIKQQCKEKNKNPDTENTSGSAEGDPPSCSNSQTIDTCTETSVSSQDAQTMIDLKARETGGGKDESGTGSENAHALILAHRDRRKDLQRWRDEDRQAKDENLRNKLTTRLQNRNGINPNNSIVNSGVE